MTKDQIAGYLISIHTLLEAQERTGVTEKSKLLIDEYNLYWGRLKDIITKESQDASRKS